MSEEEIGGPDRIGKDHWFQLKRRPLYGDLTAEKEPARDWGHREQTTQRFRDRKGQRIERDTRGEQQMGQSYGNPGGWTGATSSSPAQSTERGWGGCGFSEWTLWGKTEDLSRVPREVVSTLPLSQTSGLVEPSKDEGESS